MNRCRLTVVARLRSVGVAGERIAERNLDRLNLATKTVEEPGVLGNVSREGRQHRLVRLRAHALIGAGINTANRAQQRTRVQVPLAG